MIFRKTTTFLAVAFLIAACATRQESTPKKKPDDAPELTANFVDSPAKKTAIFSGLGSFFSQFPPRKNPPPPAATPVQWAGEIRMVNTAENFVLIESLTAVATIPGEKYLSIRDTRETGAVRMTSLRNPPFLIADIISGDPSPGDKIHLPRPTVPVPNATPASKPSLIPKFLREILPFANPNK